jgi:hypothetical protein
MHIKVFKKCVCLFASLLNLQILKKHELAESYNVCLHGELYRKGIYILFM